MGYYTHFKLVTDPEYWLNDRTVEDMDYINEITGGYFSACIIGMESGKWYDHEEHFIEISKQYPDVLFELRGSGEENGDIWVEYFKNGECKTTRAIIRFDDPPEWANKTTWVPER